ncbi:hypothetical protein N2152v2_001179 [Parachlorella kessleri]
MCLQQLQRGFFMELRKATDRALEWCLAHLYRLGDLIQLMHVVPTMSPDLVAATGSDYVPILLESDPQEDIDHVDAARRFIKERAGDQMTAAGVPFKVAIVHFATDAGSVGEAICNRASYLQVRLKCQADAVVMRKHQRGRLATLLLGSVTDYCLHHLKQPLILLQ